MPGPTNLVTVAMTLMNDGNITIQSTGKAIAFKFGSSEAESHGPPHMGGGALGHKNDSWVLTGLINLC